MGGALAYDLDENIDPWYGRYAGACRTLMWRLLPWWCNCCRSGSAMVWHAGSLFWAMIHVCMACALYGLCFGLGVGCLHLECELGHRLDGIQRLRPGQVALAEFSPPVTILGDNAVMTYLGGVLVAH